MQVAIVGVGRLGGTLARAFGSHGHDVLVASSRPTTQTAATVAGWPRVVAADLEELAAADVLVLATPHGAAAGVLDRLALDGRVVVDATNAFTDDMEPVEVDDPRGTTGMLARHAPGARLVKAFNTLPAERYVEDARERAATSRRAGLPVAADDVAAGDEVADLAGDAGFTAVPVGDLTAGAALMQPASPLYNVPLSAAELQARLDQLRG